MYAPSRLKIVVWLGRQQRRNIKTAARAKKASSNEEGKEKDRELSVLSRDLSTYALLAMAARALLLISAFLRVISALVGQLPTWTRRTSKVLTPCMSVVKVGVIGAGRIGLVHLEALSSCQNAECVIVSNPTVAKAEAAAKLHNVPAWTADANDVIDHPDVEAVWICSPSSYHAEQIVKCAAAGKSVFCEKPIATDLPETIEAINFCNAAGIKLMTALQRRFDPNFARVKQSIVSGEVGEPIVVKLCSRDPAPPPYEYVKGGGGMQCVVLTSSERAWCCVCKPDSWRVLRADTVSEPVVCSLTPGASLC